MEAYILDFVNFMLRWLHVIAAIAWIGESIYFVMLDNSLKPPQAENCKKKGVFGEMWAVHGGGFYHNQKYATSPGTLPADLHWSFWKSYTTWLSGFALFVILYMVNPGFYLVNTNSSWQWAAELSGWQANVAAVLFLVFGWVVYNELCKRISPNMERDGILSIAVGVLLVIVAYVSTQLFAGRAAFLLTGAVMATAMSANVFFWIIPGQRRMVDAMKAGEEPNPIDGKRLYRGSGMVGHVAAHICRRRYPPVLCTDARGQNPAFLPSGRWCADPADVLGGRAHGRVPGGNGSGKRRAQYDDA